MCIRDSPDAVSSNVDVPWEPLYDEAEYKELRKRYLEKLVRENVELPGGMTIRRQTAKAVIDMKTPGYKSLKKEIVMLERNDRHEEIFWLLKRLAQWEMKPLSTFPNVHKTTDAEYELQEALFPAPWHGTQSGVFVGWQEGAAGTDSYLDKE